MRNKKRSNLGKEGPEEVGTLGRADVVAGRVTAPARVLCQAEAGWNRGPSGMGFGGGV